MNVKAQKFFSHRATLLLDCIFAALAPLFFWSNRSTVFVFMDGVLFDGFCQLIFWLTVINALFTTVLAALRWRCKSWAEQPPEWCAAAGCATLCLTVVFTFVNIGLLAGAGESVGIVFSDAADAAPWFIAYVLGVVLAFFFPSISDKRARTVIVVLVLLIVILGVLFAVYPPVNYEFMSDPMVIDTGSDYSIVFATSAAGTGYVEYEYGGKSYVVYDENDGRINGSSTIHSVNVPYEHLNGNSYKIGSMRVFGEYAYGGMNGRTIESESYEFTAVSGEEQTLLCISDWHTRTKKAKSAVSHLGEYDGVIMLGDAAASMQKEELAAEYIVAFGGDITGGKIPVIFARGNHETRGAYAGELKDALGMHEFYYETTWGDYRFIILDSAEDKADDHVEYGGMADYTAFRTRMVEWLESLEKTDKKTVVICHSPTIAAEDYLAERAFAKIDELGAGIMLSGHYHNCYLEIDEESGFATYVDGGHNNGVFIASRVKLSASGIELYACDVEGAEKLSETVAWQSA